MDSVSLNKLSPSPKDFPDDRLFEKTEELRNLQREHSVAQKTIADLEARLAMVERSS